MSALWYVDLLVSLSVACSVCVMHLCVHVNTYLELLVFFWPVFPIFSKPPSFVLSLYHLSSKTDGSLRGNSILLYISTQTWGDTHTDNHTPSELTCRDNNYCWCMTCFSANTQHVKTCYEQSVIALKLASENCLVPTRTEK